MDRDQIRARLQARAEREVVPPSPAPRYDEEFARGVAWLDGDGADLRGFRVQVRLPTLGMSGTCDVVATTSAVYWLVLDHVRSVTGSYVDPEFEIEEIEINNDTSSERIVAWTMKVQE